MAIDLPKLSTSEIAIGSAVAVGLGALVAGAYVATRKSKTRRRKGSSSKTIRKRIRRTPRTAGKRRDTSRRRIRYTSKGQPYVIGAKGKARFISRKSAKASYKRKGGKY